VDAALIQLVGAIGKEAFPEWVQVLPHYIPSKKSWERLIENCREERSLKSSTTTAILPDLINAASSCKTS